MHHTLYGSRGSGSAAIEMALRAAKLEYHLLRASEWEPDSEIAALRHCNPLGQIPTLVLPDGTVMTESAAILIHLGLEYPNSRLLPQAPAARATALRGLVFISANCYSAVSIGDYPSRWTTATSKHAHEQVRMAARSQLHRSWEIFADAGGESLLSAKDDPGALAFLAVVVSRWSGARKHLKSTKTIFASLLEELERHPRIAPVLGEHGAA